MFGPKDLPMFSQWTGGIAILKTASFFGHGGGFWRWFLDNQNASMAAVTDGWCEEEQMSSRGGKSKAIEVTRLFRCEKGSQGFGMHGIVRSRFPVSVFIVPHR
jgi:hypothetical protein